MQHFQVVLELFQVMYQEETVQRDKSRRLLVTNGSFYLLMRRFQKIMKNLLWVMEEKSNDDLLFHVLHKVHCNFYENLYYIKKKNYFREIFTRNKMLTV